MLHAVSLFAGIGGFDLAAERAGVPVLAAAESGRLPRCVYRRHFPGAGLFRDVREVTADGLRARGVTPERCVLTAGWPCQDLSVAGRKAGLAGPRSSLWWEVARVVGCLRPAWIVAENVPGLLRSGRGADMGAVVRSLAELGYVGAWRVLDAQGFGVPQRRPRVFLVAHLGDRARAEQVLLEPGGGGAHPHPGRGHGADRYGPHS